MWLGSELFAESFPQLLPYVPITLCCFLLPTLVALVAGTLICCVRVGKKNLLYYAVTVFVSFFRGTPGLVQLYLFFFGLPKIAALFGWDINGWNALAFYVLSTCCNFSSFVSEAFRGAYEALDKGQIEAGYAVGYNRWQCFWRLIAPQTLQVALPNLKNLEIDLLKGSAVAYAIGVIDIMGKANNIIALHRGYGQIWVLLAVAVIYFIFNVLLELTFNCLTQFFSRHEGAML